MGYVYDGGYGGGFLIFLILILLILGMGFIVPFSQGSDKGSK